MKGKTTQLFCFLILMIVITCLLFVSILTLVKVDYGFIYFNPAAATLLCFSIGLFLLAVFFKQTVISFISIIFRVDLRLKLLFVFLLSTYLFCLLFQDIFEPCKYILQVPIYPIHLINSFFAHVENSTPYPTYMWAGITTFILGIPIIIWVYYKSGNWTYKKYLESSLNAFFLSNESLEGLAHSVNLLEIVQFPRILCWIKKHRVTLVAFVSAMFVFIMASFFPSSYDRPYYYVLAERIEHGDFSLFLSNIRNEWSRSGNIMSLPVVIFAIPFIELFFGNIELGFGFAFSLITFFEVILCYKIVKKITCIESVAMISIFILGFSYPFLNVNLGIGKQALSFFFLFAYLSINATYKGRYRTLLLGLIIILGCVYIMLAGLIGLFIILFFFVHNVYKDEVRKQRIWMIFRSTFLIVLFGVISLLFFKYTFFESFTILDPLLNVLFSFTGSVFEGFGEFTLPSVNSVYLFVQFLPLYLPLLIFAPIGIYETRKHEYFKKKQFFLILILFNAVIFTLTFLALFGFDFIQYRLLPYFVVFLTPFSAIGFYYLFRKIIQKPSIKDMTNRKKITVLVFSAFFIIPSILSIPSMARGTLHPMEREAISWFKGRPDYDLLLNDNITDVIIIPNSHLNYWVRYMVSTNATNENQAIGNIDAFLDKDDINLKAFFEHRLQNKAYFLVSGIREPYGKTWTNEDIFSRFEVISEVRNFTLNQYVINQAVTIFEMEF